MKEKMREEKIGKNTSGLPVDPLWEVDCRRLGRQSFLEFGCKAFVSFKSRLFFVVMRLVDWWHCGDCGYMSNMLWFRIFGQQVLLSTILKDILKGMWMGRICTWWQELQKTLQSCKDPLCKDNTWGDHSSLFRKSFISFTFTWLLYFRQVHYLIKGLNISSLSYVWIKVWKCNVSICTLHSLDGTVLPWSELTDRGGEEAVGLSVLGLLGVLLQAGQRPVLRETSSHWLCGF